MKTLLKKIFEITIATAFLCKLPVEAQVSNPQLKIKDYKFKNNPLLQMKQNQHAKNLGLGFGININPFWEDVNAPHVVNFSHVTQVEVPSLNAVWAKVDYDSLIYYDANSFLRSADGGSTWRLDSVDAPAGYGLSCISPLDGNTCFAAMYNAFAGIGGGVFKTVDGGNTWKQINAGSLFSASSFPDVVYFFDAQHGLTVGDDDGTDISRLEIYTTSDAGKTWQRVPDKNLPPTAGYAFSSNFNSYTAFQNRFWVTAGDSYGNSYIYRSDDFGQHWQQFPYTSATPIYDFAFADQQNGLGVSFDGNGAPHEVETQDGGKTWADKSFTGYPMGLFITVIPSTHTFVSTIPYDITPVAGSSYSNDFGATWHLIDSSSRFRPFALAFLNPLVGWCGRGDSQDPNGGMYKWKYQFSLDNNTAAVSTDKAIAITKNGATDLSAYPNPVIGNANISFSLTQAQKVSVNIYDLNGRLVKAIANENMEAGLHQLAWDAKDNNGNAALQGAYFISVETLQGIQTKKVILMK